MVYSVRMLEHFRPHIPCLEAYSVMAISFPCLEICESVIDRLPWILLVAMETLEGKLWPLVVRK